MAREERKVNHFERKGLSLDIAIHLPHLQQLSLSLPGLYLSRPQLPPEEHLEAGSIVQQWFPAREGFPGFCVSGAGGGSDESCLGGPTGEQVVASASGHSASVVPTILFLPTATSNANTVFVCTLTPVVCAVGVFLQAPFRYSNGFKSTLTLVIRNLRTAS